MSIKKKILSKALADDVVISSGGENSDGEAHEAPKKRQKNSENANIIPGRNVV